MTDPELPIPQMESFREQLRAAAAREIDAEAQRKRRWWRRRAVIGGVVVVGTASAVAGASKLISTGEPLKAPLTPPARYQPTGQPQIVVSAADKAVGLPWAVVAYDTAAGLQCARAGQQRGTRIGLVKGGVFRALPASGPAACRRLGPTGTVVSINHVATRPDRTLVFGRAGRRVASLRIVRPDGTSTAKTGPGGAFLFVFDGDVRGTRQRMELLDRAGRVVGRG